MEAMDDYKNKRGDYAASHGSKKKGTKSGTELLVNTYTMAMDRISETGEKLRGRSPARSEATSWECVNSASYCEERSNEL